MLSKLASDCVSVVHSPFSPRLRESGPRRSTSSRRTQHLARPDAFALDLGVLAEGRAGRRRQAEVHGVAELVAGESQPQADRLAAQRSLHRMLAALHRAREALGAGPQRGLQPALARERRNDPALRDVGEQAQRPVHVRLAAAVRAGDHVQRRKRHDEIAERTVVIDRERRDHR